MVLGYVDLFGEDRRLKEIGAQVTTEHSSSSYGQPVVVLDDGGSLDLFSWVALDYRVLRINPEEVSLMDKTGFPWR